MKIRLLKPRQLARLLRAAARVDREQVEEYLDARREEWEALAAEAPGDAADIIEELSEEAAAELLADLDPDEAAEVIGEIAPELAAELVEDLPVADLAAVIEQMSPEDAADLLGELDDDTVSDILSLIDEKSAIEVRNLLTYPHDSAGGLMTTDIAALPLGLTTGEAIERIRQLHDEFEDLSYVYVVDDDDTLRGVVSFRDLVFRRPGNALADVMVPDPLSVTAFADRELVADICQRYHIMGVPVTDDSGRLLGMVTMDAVLEAVQDEASEDFAAAVGAGAEETVYTNVGRSVRARSPWLLLNLSLALVVALVVELFTGVISRAPVLAALMPVVATLGGNSGQQSLAVVIRSLATDDVPGSQVVSVLNRQARIGVLNGLILATMAIILTTALIESGAFDSSGSTWQISLAVGIAVIVNLTIASLAGSAIPLVLRRFGQDPALASTIFLTLITDSVGFGGFLLTANALISSQ